MSFIPEAPASLLMVDPMITEKTKKNQNKSSKYQTTKPNQVSNHLVKAKQKGRVIPDQI